MRQFEGVTWCGWKTKPTERLEDWSKKKKCKWHKRQQRREKKKKINSAKKRNEKKNMLKCDLKQSVELNDTQHDSMKEEEEKKILIDE